MLNPNYANRRKNINDKEIFEFFTLLEEKFENNVQKLENFVEIFKKYSNNK